METTPEHIEESNSICFRWFLDWKALYWYTLAEFDLEKRCLWIALKPSDWNKVIPFGISTTSLKGSFILEHHFSSEVLLMRERERKKERKKEIKKERKKERTKERKKDRKKHVARQYKFRHLRLHSSEGDGCVFLVGCLRIMKHGIISTSFHHHQN